MRHNCIRESCLVALAAHTNLYKTQSLAALFPNQENKKLQTLVSKK
jgi:hypothetical protein